MRRLLKVFVTLFTLSLAPLMRLGAQGKESLRLIQTIPMPNVKAALTTWMWTVKGKRLFIAGPPDLSSRSSEGCASVSSQRSGDAAFDEGTRRLLIGTRTPPQMVAMDSQSGKEVAHLPTVEGMDGVYFDAAHKRVYVSGGRGFDVGNIFVYQQAGVRRRAERLYEQLDMLQHLRQTTMSPRLPMTKKRSLFSSSNPGDPRSGSKVWDALDREIGKPGENRGQIIAHWEFQPSTAFHDRKNRRDLGSCLWTADVYPILSVMYTCT